jgi:hypothetical protein
MAVKTVLVFFEHVKRIYSPDDYVDLGELKTENIILDIIENIKAKTFNASSICKKKKSLDPKEVDAILKKLASDNKIKPTGKKVSGSKYEIYEL